MNTVTDQLCPDIWIFYRGRDHTGVSVMNTGHCVEKVGQVGHTRIHSGFCVVWKLPASLLREATR